MHPNQKNNRRAFMKICAASIAALPFSTSLNSILGGGIAQAADGLPAGEKTADLNNPLVNAIGYKHEIKDIDAKRFPQRSKPEAKNQFCENCALYTKKNDKWGKCSMIQEGLVAAKGWCGSYSKKA